MQIVNPRLAAKLASIKSAPVEVATWQPDPAIARFVDYLYVRRRSPKTIANYRSELRLAEQAIGKPLTSATKADMNALFARLSQGTYKAGTIGKKRACLREFYKWAKRQEIMHDDPTIDVEVPRAPHRLPIHMTEEQVQAIFDVLSEDGLHALRECLIVKTLYYTGCRASELVGLTWERVNLSACELAVIGKGNKERKIPISSALVALLERYKAQHPTGTGHVLLRANGRPLSYDTLYRTVRRVLARAELAGKGFSPHKFRHTAATRLLHGGLQLDKIQKLLGHANVATTQIYAHTEIGAETREAMNRIL